MIYPDVLIFHFIMYGWVVAASLMAEKTHTHDNLFYGRKYPSTDIGSCVSFIKHVIPTNILKIYTIILLSVRPSVRPSVCLSVCRSVLAHCRSIYRLGRCLKLFVSTDSTSSHEFASQFGLAFFLYAKYTHKLS